MCQMASTEKREAFTFRGKGYQTVSQEGQDIFLVYSVSDDWLYIESIVIAEGKRGQGIGEATLKRVLAQYENRDAYLLATRELGGDEARLKKWYGRHGFVSVKDKNDLPFNYNMMLKRR